MRRTPGNLRDYPDRCLSLLAGSKDSTILVDGKPNGAEGQVQAGKHRSVKYGVPFSNSYRTDEIPLVG
jgi:hypothetical protein